MLHLNIYYIYLIKFVCLSLAAEGCGYYHVVTWTGLNDGQLSFTELRMYRAGEFNVKFN